MPAALDSTVRPSLVGPQQRSQRNTPETVSPSSADQTLLSARSQTDSQTRDVTSEYSQTRDLPDGGKRVSYDFVTADGIRIQEEYRYDRDGNLVERVLTRRWEVQGEGDLRRFKEQIVASVYGEGEPQHTVTERQTGEYSNGASYEHRWTIHPNGEEELMAQGRHPGGQEFSIPFQRDGWDLPEPPPAGTEPAFSVTEKVVELEDGGRRVISQFSDETSGLNEVQITLYDREGRPVERVSESRRRAEYVEDDVDGLGILSGLINNPQALLNSLGDDLTQSEIRRQVETFDPPSKTVSDLTVWEGEHGTLTRIEQEGQATRWEVRKRDGGRLLTQTFVEGSEDTTVTETYQDEDGFTVTHTESDTRDLAEMSQGEKVPEFGESTVATKEKANLDDLKELLGDEAFAQLSEESEAFRELIAQFEKGEFTLSQIESHLRFPDGTEQNQEAITLAGEDNLAALVYDRKSGRWSVSDLPEDPQHLTEEQTAELLSNPANLAVAGLAVKLSRHAGKYMGWANHVLGPVGRHFGSPALGPMFGLASGGLATVAGIQEMIHGDVYRGGFQLMAGAGGLMTSVAGLGSSVGLNAGAAMLGPIGWALVGVGTGLGFTYDYMDRHRVADLAI